MTTYSSVLATYSNAATSAALKDLMNSVATLMTNAGFAKSTEAGEIDISAVTYSSVGGTSYGFQVWYLNDSMHGTAPIYIRLLWKMPTTSNVGLAFTIGHASDGAGNITGYKNGSDSTYIFTGTSWGLAGVASKACSLTGYGFWELCAQASASTTLSPWFLLSREWDASTGDIAANGNYTFMWRGATSYQTQLSVNRAESLTYNTAALSALGSAPGGKTTSLRGAYTDIFKIQQIYPNRGYKPSGAICLYNASEMSQFSTFSANILGGGSARTWLATGNPMFVAASEVDHLSAVLWE